MSLEQIQAFLEGTDEVEFEGANRREVYDWISRTILPPISGLGG